MEETLKFTNRSVSEYTDMLFTSSLNRINEDMPTKLSVKKFLDDVFINVDKAATNEVEWKGFDSIDIKVEAIVTEDKSILNEEKQVNIVPNLSPVISRKSSHKSVNKSEISESRRNSIKQKIDNKMLIEKNFNDEEKVKYFKQVSQKESF
jgi:hypothetical protein